MRNFARNLQLSAIAVALAVSPVAPLMAKGGGGSSSSSSASSGPISEAARCAGMFEMMKGMVPPGSDQVEAVELRRTTWLDFAASQSSKAEATGQMQRAAAELRAAMIETRGDAAQMEALMAGYKICENPPEKPKPVITDRDRQSGDLAIRCAGMARLYEDTDNVLATTLYGKEPVYQSIIDHFRPDLTGKEREDKVLLAMRDHARIVIADNEANDAKVRAGEGGLEPDDMIAIQRAGECARMVNALRAVSIID